jgi:hypothetical protein
MRHVQRRRLLTRAIDKRSADVAAVISPLLARQGKVVERSLRKANLRKRLKKADGDPSLDYADSWSEWGDEFSEALSDALGDSIDVLTTVESAYWMSRGMGPIPAFVPANIIDAYQTKIGRLITKISDDTLEDVQSRISSWYKTDKGLPQLIDELEPLFGESRAALIASTEMVGIASELSSEMAQSMGIGNWLWDAFSDAFTCPECSALGEDKTLFTFDDPQPPLHPGCRCGMLFATADGEVIKSFPAPAMRKFFRAITVRGQTRVEFEKYSPDQERDDHGRFGSGGDKSKGGGVYTRYGNSQVAEGQWTPSDPNAKAPAEVPKTGPKSDLQKLTSRSEINAWCRSNLGISTMLTGLDTISRIRIASTLYDLKQEYPKAFDRLKGIYVKDIGSKDAYAQVERGRNIMLNSQFFSGNMKAAEDSLRDDVLSGWHPTGTGNVEAVITHEFGHLLFPSAGRGFGGQTAIVKEATAFLSNLRDGSRLPSRYATTNVWELFAESFSSFRFTPGPSQSAFVKDVFPAYLEKAKGRK